MLKNNGLTIPEAEAYCRGSMTDTPQMSAPMMQGVKKPVDPVARSLAKPDACAKPATMGKGVRVRVMSGDKSMKRRKRRKNDPRDVKFY